MVHLERLGKLAPDALGDTLRGVEKESLRVTPDGRLATTPHPAALGAALTHPNITTDFSESQIELITGVHPDADACVQELTEIHQFVYRALGEEMLWASSMPCRLPPDERIITRMRFWDDISVADIARTLGIEQKPLYRKIESIKAGLRACLEARGIDRERAAEVLSGEVIW